MGCINHSVSEVFIVQAWRPEFDDLVKQKRKQTNKNLTKDISLNRGIVEATSMQSGMIQECPKSPILSI